MCFGGGGSPPPPPPPTPAAPAAASKAVQMMGTNASLAARAAAGPAGTLLTGPMGLSQTTTGAAKSLLGQ